MHNYLRLVTALTDSSGENMAPVSTKQETHSVHVWLKCKMMMINMLHTVNGSLCSPGEDLPLHLTHRCPTKCECSV